MDNVPAYVSLVFILTTLATVAFLVQSIKAAGTRSVPSKILAFLLPLWLLFSGTLAIGGFYREWTVFPPRVVLFAVLPALVTIAAYFIFFRKSFIEFLPLRTLTALHVVRIPVEITLFWLASAGAIPILMTFEGRNFDIVSGLLAPVVWWLGFRNGRVNKPLLIAYNILAFILLANVVGIAVLSMPSPAQQIALDTPNRAVSYFPYIWLPAVVVPAVLFAHLAALWKLISGKVS